MRILTGLAIGFLLQYQAYAQDVQFSVTANPNVLHVGEQFNLMYTSNQQVSDLDVPDVADFEFLGGPSQGHSQSVYSNNGKITTTSTYQYTYFYRAVKAGKFTIPAATARINNKEYKSNSVSVEVAEDQTQAPQQGGNVGSDQEGNPEDRDRLWF
jgi:hypothetical protein